MDKIKILWEKREIGGIPYRREKKGERILMLCLGETWGVRTNWSEKPFQGEIRGESREREGRGEREGPYGEKNKKKK